MQNYAVEIHVGTTTKLQIVLNIKKKPLLKSSNAKKYLPNFPTPKNPEINNYKPKVGHRVTSLEIKSILPPPPLGIFMMDR